MAVDVVVVAAFADIVAAVVVAVVALVAVVAIVVAAVAAAATYGSHRRKRRQLWRRQGHPLFHRSSRSVTHANTVFIILFISVFWQKTIGFSGGEVLGRRDGAPGRRVRKTTGLIRLRQTEKTQRR